MQDDFEPGYCICARWPKAIKKAGHSWEAWTKRLPSTEIAIEAHKKLISRGADKRYDFGLFRSDRFGAPFKLIRRLRT